MDWILQNTSPLTLTTADINENIKVMMNMEGPANIGKCYTISRQVLLREMLDGFGLSQAPIFRF